MNSDAHLTKDAKKAVLLDKLHNGLRPAALNVGIEILEVLTAVLIRLDDQISPSKRRALYDEMLDRRADAMNRNAQPS